VQNENETVLKQPQKMNVVYNVKEICQTNQ